MDRSAASFLVVQVAIYIEYVLGPMVSAGVLHYLPAPFLPRPELYAIYVTLTVRAIPSWCSRATRAGRCSEPDEQAVNPTLVVLVLADAGAEIYGRCHRAPLLPVAVAPPIQVPVG